jgi:hypothetical protein
MEDMRGLLYSGSKAERRDHRLSVQAKDSGCKLAVSCIGEPWESERRKRRYIPKREYGMCGCWIPPEKGAVCKHGSKAKYTAVEYKARRIEALISLIAMEKAPLVGNPHAKGEYAWHEWNAKHEVKA